MKKALTLLLLALTFVSVQTFAQDRVITGKVTSAEDSQPLPGVSVIVKGTTSGTITDVDGNYKLTVPSGSNTLVYKFIGMETKEVPIGSSNTINVALGEDVLQLGEVVVTALGISREKKALGYAVQELDNEEITRVPQTNVITALTGKVAGVNITNSPSMGGSSRILIRGVNSVTGNNQPLFVVDGIPVDNTNYTSANQARGGGGYDYGNMIQDLNPNDIKSVTVLKGPSAAALYGSRASNGVILIETKSGKGAVQRGIGVEYNLGVMFESVAILPNYQNSYGGGFGFDTLFYDDLSPADQQRYMPKGGTYTDPNNRKYDLLPQYYVDESWGPKLDQGTLVRHWDSFDPNDADNYGVSREWASNPGNIRDFFETGVTITNNISLVGGDAKNSFRLSYTNAAIDGIFPNSTLTRNIINASGATELSDKLTASTTFNYTKNEALGRPGTGYDALNVMQQFNQWSHRQFDMERLKNYKTETGQHQTWNRTAYDDPTPKYSDNPYWTRYENYQNDDRDRFFGTIGATYELTDWLEVRGNLYGDFYTDHREERIAVGSQEVPMYSEAVRRFSETNSELIFRLNRSLSEDWSLTGLAGGNMRYNTYSRNIGNTQGGLSVPGLYNLRNSIAPIEVDDYYEQKQVNSLFASASLGWKSTIYVDATVRNDWSSTLPEANNSYMYPSVSTSIVLSELGGLKEYNWLSFAKIRAGWAQVGNDTDPYNIESTIVPIDNFGPYPSYTMPNLLNNSDLRPEITSSWEVGVEAAFFKNRLAFDITYYDAETRDQILPVDVSSATGFRAMWVNAGKMTNNGIELLLSGSPVKTKDFEWSLQLNWAKNTNQLVELTEDLENYRLVNAPFKVTLNAREGASYGAIIGTDYVYDESGNRVVDANGMYMASDEVKVLGSVLPDWVGGLRSSLAYKGINFGFLIDMQKGGSYYSIDHMFGMYSGMYEETVENGIRENGIILDGVKEEGTPNDVPLDAELYGLNHYFVDAMNVFDAGYTRLREISLGYSIPAKKLENTPIVGLQVSAVGYNLITWGLDWEGYDPDNTTNAGNIQGIVGSGMPGIRSYGINLKLKL